MGLLDNLFSTEGMTDEQAARKQGLLSAAYSLIGNTGSFGQGLGQAGLAGLNASQGYKDQALKRKYMQTQMEDADAQRKQREAEVLRQQKIMEFLSGKLGGQPAPSAATQALDQGAQAGSVGPTVDNAQRMGLLQQQQQPQAFPFSLDDVVKLHAMGGPNLMDALKYANTPISMQPGSINKDPVTGKERYIPTMVPGTQLDAQGNAQEVPNFGAVNAGIKAAETRATEGAKAQFDFVDQWNPATGRMEKVRKDIASGMFNPAPSVPAAPVPAAPKTSRPADQVVTPAQQAASNAESLRIMMLERNRATDPATQAALDKEIARLKATGSPVSNTPTFAGGMPAGPSDAEKQAAAVSQKYAEGQVTDVLKRREGIYAAGDAAPNKIAQYQQIGSLLNGFDGGKFSPTGVEIAKTLNSIGIKVDPNLANKEAAQVFSNQMALQLRNPAGGAGMPGAMSDADRQYLTQMVPSLSNSAEGRAKIIQAATAVERRNQQVAAFARNYEKKYGKLDNDFFSQLSAWSDKNPIFGKK